MNEREFVLSQLPRAPARVLEIGCGEGALARMLVDQGYDLVAIDPDAPAGEIFRRVSLEEYRPEGPFHAVLASRSLHHVHDLSAALQKVHAALEPGGVLILDEFAWDRLDRETAVWFYAQRRVHKIANHPAPATIDELEQEWRSGHEHLHGYDVIRDALDRHFRERMFEWCPYLHRYFEDVDLEKSERDAIDQAAIRAIGFRYVGER